MKGRILHKLDFVKGRILHKLDFVKAEDPSQTGLCEGFCFVKAESFTKLDFVKAEFFTKFDFVKAESFTNLTL